MSKIMESARAAVSRRSKHQVTLPEIKTNLGALVPARLITALYGLVGIGTIALATQWMLNGVQLIFVGLAVVAAGYNFYNPSPLLGLGGLGLTALYFLTPAGASVGLTSFALLFTATAGLRLTALLSVAGPTTRISMGVLRHQARLYGLVVSGGAIVLLLVMLVGSEPVLNPSWLYLSAAAFVTLAIMCGRGLAVSHRAQPPSAKGPVS